MPIFSGLIIGIIIYEIIKKNNLKNLHKSLIAIDAILLLYWPQGYFISIGTVKISDIQSIVDLILLFTSLLIIKELKINKKLFMFGSAFFLIILTGTLYEFVSPISTPIINNYGDWDYYAYGMISKGPIDINFKEQFIFYLIIINYIFNIFIIKTIYTSDELIQLLIRIVSWGSLVVFVGVIEFTVKNIMNLPDLFYEFKEIFLGLSSKTVHVGVLRGAFYSLEGITTEPSHYTVTLFLSSMFAVVLKKIKSVNYSKEYNHFLISFVTSKWYIFIAILLMYLSGGLSGILYIIMTFIGYVIIMNDLHMFSLAKIRRYLLYGGIILIGCIGTGYFLYHYGEGYIAYRIDISIAVLESLLSGDNITIGIVDSSIPRFISNVDVLKDFLQRPLWGLGVGVQTAFGEFSTMFSYFGIIGVIAWIMTINQSRIGNKKTEYDKVMFVFLFFIAGIFHGVTHMQLPMINIAYMILYETTSLYIVNDRA